MGNISCKKTDEKSRQDPCSPENIRVYDAETLYIKRHSTNKKITNKNINDKNN